MMDSECGTGEQARRRGVALRPGFEATKGECQNYHVTGGGGVVPASGYVPPERFRVGTNYGPRRWDLGTRLVRVTLYSLASQTAPTAAFRK
jgi:hypothetical protein